MRYTGTGHNYKQIEKALMRLGATPKEADALTEILHVEGWGGDENNSLGEDLFESKIEWLRSCRPVEGPR